MANEDNTLTVDQITRLLRLYLSWPVNSELLGKSRADTDESESRLEGAAYRRSGSTDRRSRGTDRRNRLQGQSGESTEQTDESEIKSGESESQSGESAAPTIESEEQIDEAGTGDPEAITVESEAQEFYDWLGSELDEQSLEELTNGIEGIEQFIEVNAPVITAGRKLKAEITDGSRDGREEERILSAIPVFVVIYDCEKAPELEGVSLNGVMMDMAKSGMRLESDVAVPAGSIITMTVVAEDPRRLYHLTGEIRWLSIAEEINQMGISIFNIEDYDRWRRRFESSFGQPGA